MAVKLFEEDLYSKDYKELADWIVACRNVVDKNLCRDDEDYAYSVDAFCSEWEEHYSGAEILEPKNREWFNLALDRMATLTKSV